MSKYLTLADIVNGVFIMIMGFVLVFMANLLPEDMKETGLPMFVFTGLGIATSGIVYVIIRWFKDRPLPKDENKV